MNIVYVYQGEITYVIYKDIIIKGYTIQKQNNTHGLYTQNLTQSDRLF